MTSTSHEFVGRPSVLWTLEPSGGGAVTCLAGEIESGAFRISIVGIAGEPRSRTFEDIADAIRWAINQESILMARGWTKLL